MEIGFGARSLILAGAAAALLACGKQQATANDGANAASAAPATAENASAAVDNANATAAASGAASGGMNADFLVGKWSAFGEDCKNTIEFRKDGTAVTPIGEAKWTLTGDKLLFDYSDGSKQPPSTVKALGGDRMEITRGSGAKETEKRC